MSVRQAEKLGLDQIRAFLEASEGVQFEGEKPEEIYGWVSETLQHQSYGKRNRAERGLLRSYIAKLTGLSRAQVTRLIGRYLGCGEVKAPQAVVSFLADCELAGVDNSSHSHVRNDVQCRPVPSSANARCGYFHWFFGSIVGGVVRGKEVCRSSLPSLSVVHVCRRFSFLVGDREVWREEGSGGATLIRQITEQCSTVPAGSEVDFANVTHAFSNGLSDALHANGFPLSVRIRRNFSSPDSDQQRLVEELLRCQVALPDAGTNRTILVEVGDHTFKSGTPCASSVVDSDRALRPNAWRLVYSGQ